MHMCSDKAIQIVSLHMREEKARERLYHCTCVKRERERDCFIAHASRERERETVSLHMRKRKQESDCIIAYALRERDRERQERCCTIANALRGIK